MFPPVQTPNQRPNRPKRPKYLPISPSDTAATTGQLINPVGAMYPVGINANQGGSNTFNGQYGSQGQFGSMLPTVNVNGQSPQFPASLQTTQIPGVQGFGVNRPSFPNLGPTPPLSTPLGGTPAGQYVPFQTPKPVNAPYNEGQTSPFTPVPSEQISQINNQYQVASMTGNPALLPPKLTSAQAYQSGFTQQPGFNQLYQFNTQTREYQLKSQTPGQNTATSQAGNGGNTDFMNTKFMQQNAANNVAFTNQLRWDPTTKKYQKIGNLLRQGKLDIKTGKDKRPRGGGGGNSQAASGGINQNTGSTTGNFGAATG